MVQWKVHNAFKEKFLPENTCQNLIKSPDMPIKTMGEKRLNDVTMKHLAKFLAQMT